MPVPTLSGSHKTTSTRRSKSQRYQGHTGCVPGRGMNCPPPFTPLGQHTNRLPHRCISWLRKSTMLNWIPTCGRYSIISKRKFACSPRRSKKGKKGHSPPFLYFYLTCVHPHNNREQPLEHQVEYVQVIFGFLKRYFLKHIIKVQSLLSEYVSYPFKSSCI